MGLPIKRQALGNRRGVILIRFMERTLAVRRMTASYFCLAFGAPSLRFSGCDKRRKRPIFEFLPVFRKVLSLSHQFQIAWRIIQRISVFVMYAVPIRNWPKILFPNYLGSEL